MARTIVIWIAAVSMLASCNFGRPALEFTPPELQPARIGQPYLAAISVEQNETPVGEMWVSEGDLPPGLELNFLGRGSDTGEISGTPTAAGTYTFSVGVWCLGTNVSGQTGSASYTLVVN